MDFSDWSECLGSNCSSVWQIHVEGNGKEGKEGKSGSCLLIISWVS